MIEKRNSFSKQERLTGKIAIDRLFTSGKSFFVYPFLIQYELIHEERAIPTRVLISVSKRKFKRAVDRNSIKRQIREAYRQLKPDHLNCPANTHLNVGIIYVGKVKISSVKLASHLQNSLIKLNQKVNDPVD